MTTLATSGITAEQFLELDDNGLELVDGEIVESELSALSAYVATRLVVRMSAHADAGGLGLVFGAGSGIAIWPDKPDKVRKPDGMFFTNGKFPEGIPATGWIRVSPDIALEVVSPRDSAEELDKKLRDYRQAGIPLVWVIYPATRSGHAYRGRTVRPVFEEDALDGEDIFPGFRLPLSQFFAAVAAEGVNTEA